MTVYEHVMVGASLALAAGLHQRQGWRIVALAGITAALPDWDGLSILFGPAAYAECHRAWGHNLVAATLLGGLAGGTEYRLNLLGRLQQRVVARFPRLLPAERLPALPAAGFSRRAVVLWIVTGSGACLSHLPIDMVYAGHSSLSAWPVKLFWPFSQQGWALPIVPWGDLGTTLIFVSEMFVLYRWPNRPRRIATLALVAVLAYIAVWWIASR